MNENCVTNWPGCATAGPEGPWFSEQSCIVLQPMSHVTFFIFLHILPTFTTTHQSQSSTFLSFNSLCRVFPFLPAASPCSLLSWFEEALLLTVWSAKQNHRNIFASLLPCSCSSCRQPLFLFFPSLAARQSVGKFGMWPPAQAEEEKINRPEVSQWCQSSYCNEVNRFLYTAAC